MSRHGFDLRGLLALVAVLAAGAACAAPLSTDDTGCGGDAYSSAEVVQGRSRRGPLTAMPDTLCADLAAPPGRTRIEIYGVPGLGGADRGETGPGGYGAGGGYDAGRLGRDGLGGTGESAPYELRPPRRPRRGD